MAVEPGNNAGKAADAAGRTTKAAIDAGTAVGKTATEAGSRIAQTASGAGTEIGRTAAGAGAEMSRTATSAGVSMAQNAADAGAAAMGEFNRMFAEMKLPAMPDMRALMDAHRRNMETLSAANRVALEGAQAVARRHMEIMQQTMSEVAETMQSFASAEPPQAKAAKQAELMKQSYERAVSNMRELSDLIQRANGEALTLLNQRFTQAMDEVRGMLQKSGQGMPGGTSV